MNDHDKINLLQRALNESFYNIATLEDIHLTSFLVQFNYLRTATGEGDLVERIWSGLLVRAEQQSQPLLWLEKELNYEMAATSVGDRRRVASEALESGQLTDETLETYNDRLARW